MEIRTVANTPSVAASPDAGTPVADTSATGRGAAAPVEKTALVQQPAQPVPHEQLKQALEQINQAMRQQAANLEFSVDGDTDRTIVRVVDQDTQEVIRQMPTKEALEIAKALDRMQSLLVNHKV